ncbi:RNA polymerase sigma factor [Nocardia grenadensis]|uniref:RNA polymerase sigma factor n=1 Tax=Nocardia grenadensis TaxID=931537 RepID=UPI003D8A9D8F
MSSQPAMATVWRREAPHLLVALLRRHGDLAECEDAAQEAAAAAAAADWGRNGIPDNPRAWLIRVASRRLIDYARADRSRIGREEAVAAACPADAHLAPSADESEPTRGDDTLQLFLLCCHPNLTRPSQVALPLRAVAGLSVDRIAAAFLVPERTMTQRLTRARATLRTAGARFELPAPADLPERLAAVLDACHLMFTVGHTASTGTFVHDPGVAQEALRLTRELHRAVPDHDEVTGALALMLLTHARAAARTDPHGELVTMVEQDRGRWDRHAIAEGVALLEHVLPRGHVGRYQLEAAIAAVHAEAPTWTSTDWRQICMLYALLDRVAPSPAVTLNRAVAVAMVGGADLGLRLTRPLLDDPAMRRHHRLYAVRAHLLEMAGDVPAAAENYRPRGGAHHEPARTAIPQRRTRATFMRRRGRSARLRPVTARSPRRRRGARRPVRHPSPPAPAPRRPLVRVRVSRRWYPGAVANRKPPSASPSSRSTTSRHSRSRSAKRPGTSAPCCTEPGAGPESRRPAFGFTNGPRRGPGFAHPCTPAP